MRGTQDPVPSGFARSNRVPVIILKYWKLDKNEKNLVHLRKLGKPVHLFELTSDKPIFAVGDVTAFECFVNRIDCVKFIFDGHSQRERNSVFETLVMGLGIKPVVLHNLPGEINFHNDSQLLDPQHRFIEIIGEEDLLVLQLALLFPRGIILFGSNTQILFGLDIEEEYQNVLDCLSICGSFVE